MTEGEINYYYPSVKINDFATSPDKWRLCGCNARGRLIIAPTVLFCVSTTFVGDGDPDVPKTERFVYLGSPRRDSPTVDTFRLIKPITVATHSNAQTNTLH